MKRLSLRKLKHPQNRIFSQKKRLTKLTCIQHAQKDHKLLVVKFTFGLKQSKSFLKVNFVRKYLAILLSVYKKLKAFTARLVVFLATLQLSAAQYQHSTDFLAI